MHKYYVWLNGELIDIVFFDYDDVKEVKKSLIEHDEYHPAIVVKKER